MLAHNASELSRTFALDVAWMAADFSRATNPQDSAEGLAMALNRLRRVARLPFQIGDEEWEGLICAINEAWSVAHRCLPASFDRGRLRRGMEAAIALVGRMKLSPVARRANAGGLCYALDHTLILECTATALSVEIDMGRREAIEREAKRTAVVIQFPPRAPRSAVPEDVFR